MSTTRLGSDAVHTKRTAPIGALLTPRTQVVWVSADGTIAQALERMKPNGYTAVPLLDDSQRYVGSLSTGDLLWYLAAHGGFSADSLNAPVALVPRKMRDSPVHVLSALSTVIERLLDQSFVAVVDDDAALLGIIRRRSLIERSVNVTPSSRWW